MEKEQAKNPRALGSERIAALDVWREAPSIVRRYPLATIVPAVVLGALAEAFVLIGDSILIDETLTNLATAFTYYIYVAYIEEVVLESSQGVDSVSIRGRLRKLWRAFPVAFRILVAEIVLAGVLLVAVVVLGFAAAVATELGLTEIVAALLFLLLLLPSGLWLLTRLSLFAPALCREHLGPIAALKRSNELVRGHFWLVFRTATLAFLLEEVTDEPAKLVAELAFGSWGVWIGSTIVSALITPLAAITTSLAYHRISTHKQRLSSEAHRGEEHVGGEAH
jgi:hypothetical protein